MYLAHSDKLERRLQETIKECERWGHNVKTNIENIIEVWKEYIQQFKRE